MDSPNETTSAPDPDATLARRLALLDAVTNALIQESELDGVLRRTLDAVLEITGVSGGGVFLFDERSGELHLTVHRGVSDRLATSFARNAGQTLRGLATDPEATLLVSNLTDASRHRPEIAEEGVRAYAAIPLQARGRPLGVIVVLSTTQSDFNAADVDLLQSMGKHIGLAIERASLYEASERSLRRAQAFQEVATAITDSLELQTTLERVLDVAMDVFEADRAAIYLTAPGGGQMHCPAARNLSDAYLAAVRAYSDTAERPDALDQERSLFVEDAQTSHVLPALADAARREGFRSILYLPLPDGTDRLGTLVLYHNWIRRYTEHEVMLARTFADQANIAIRHARLFDAERRSREHASTILEATRSVTSSLQLQEVLTESGRCIAAAMGQPVCAIWLLNEAGTALTPAFRVSQRENPALDAVFASLPELPLDEVPRARHMVENPEPMIVPAGAGLSEPEMEVWRRLPFHTYVAIPLAARDQVIGAAVVPIVGSRTFSTDDVEVATAIARSTALAVENARLHERSRQLAVLEERNRLARELHDSVMHALFSMSLISQALPALVDRDMARARERIDRLNELGRGAMAEMRALIFELRPAAFEEQGLAVALAKHIAAFESREGIAVDLKIEGEHRLPNSIEEAAFRVAQEALNNVAKHARATRVSVRLTMTMAELDLVVVDDGAGFDPMERPIGQRTLGLTSMRERAMLLGGDCTIGSASAQGTTVRLRLPVRADR
jgi:signal transduction histidine kinase/GTP-sensing pleiotropic transcriptional regulator CodY